MVAQEEAERVGGTLAVSLWDEAERCYREALRLEEAGGNLIGAASSSHQLANVCSKAGRLAEAEVWLCKALAVCQQVGDKQHEAMCANNLAGLLLAVEPLPPAARPAPFRDRDLLAEAEEYARRAWEIDKHLDASVEPWKDCSILAQIAERRGSPEEARRWRRREQESFAAFAGAGAQLPSWVEPVVQAVVAACEGSAEARKQIEALFPRFKEGNWRIVDAIQRIWDGERDLDALTDGIDRNSALIVRRILESLGEEYLG